MTPGDGVGVEVAVAVAPLDEGIDVAPVHGHGGVGGRHQRVAEEIDVPDHEATLAVRSQRPDDAFYPGP